jgi:lipopolysaccharide export LptBFGC system permease protein LptF
MEEEQEQKVGVGIWAIAIIEFILEAITIFGAIFAITNKSKVDSIAKQANLPITPLITYIIVLIFAILIVVSVILILCKNTIGVFGYFIIYIGSFIYTIVQNGFKPLSLVSLILPVLMAIFVYQKRTIFKISRGEEE